MAIASEGKMRVEAAGLVGDNLASEAAPISHTGSGGGIEIRPSPFLMSQTCGRRLYSYWRQMQMKGTLTCIHACIYIYIYTYVQHIYIQAHSHTCMYM